MQSLFPSARGKEENERKSINARKLGRSRGFLSQEKGASLKNIDFAWLMSASSSQFLSFSVCWFLFCLSPAKKAFTSFPPVVRKVQKKVREVGKCRVTRGSLHNARLCRSVRAKKAYLLFPFGDQEELPVNERNGFFCVFFYNYCLIPLQNWYLFCTSKNIQLVCKNTL